MGVSQAEILVWRDANPKLHRQHRQREFERNAERMQALALLEPARKRKSYPKDRAIRLKKKYNLTFEQWELLFDSQGKRCAICKTTEPGGKGWHTDHCHASNKIRGILCGRCNIGLGQFQDNTERITAALEYLRNHAAF